MTPVVLLPVAVFAFLGGASLGRSRRGLSMLPPSKTNPLGVSCVAWRTFVVAMAASPRDRRERGKLGMFGMDARRLSDVGFMEAPKKMQVAGASSWTGTWRAPLDEGKFLASAPAQYEAFSRSVARMAPAAAPHVGAVVDGKKASLSGLLAVGHLAGEGGIESWVLDPAVRKRFAQTTANFDKANGIF